MKKLILLALPLSLLMAIDFTMTQDGLFPDTTIGQEQTISTSTSQGDNHAPTVSNVTIQGVAKVGSTLTLNYSFNDIDGDTEGQSTIAWSTPTKELQNSTSKTFVIPAGYEGQKIGAWIRAVDVHGLNSTSVYAAENNYLTILPSETNTTNTTNTTGLMGPIEGKSQYLEEVNLPKCDASNPEVQFIQSNSDWSHINDADKRIFCVSPGDYTSLGNIELTASGTNTNKRYIILYNGNETHAGKLEDTELAFYALMFNNANYWVIDRPSFKGVSSPRIYRFRGGSSHNIINRAYVRDFFTAFYITDNCNANTIQKCRLQDQTHSARTGDVMAILFTSLVFDEPSVEIKNNKLISNEIRNSNDGIHLVRNQLNAELTSFQDVNYEGTIIDSNDIYITNAIYTDGKGNYTPTGDYAYAENALDVKGGTDNSNNPLVITNNHFWGYRKSDTTNSYVSDAGDAIVLHLGVNNAIINNNVIFDSDCGINGGDNRDQPYALYNSEIKNNLFVDCGSHSSRTTSSIILTESATTTIEGNKIFDGRKYIAEFRYNSSGLMFKNNDIINAENENYWLDSNYPNIQELNNNIFSTPEAGGYIKDYSFSTDKFTNKPRVITLKNVLKSN